MNLVREVGYAYAYSFAYSPRPGTPAANFEQAAPEEVKRDRLRRLQALILEQQLAFNQSKLGQEMDILIEREGKLPGQMIGKSPWMQSVYLEQATHLKGEIVRVRITGAFPNSLSAKILEPIRQVA